MNIPFTKHTLPNGLDVLVHEDHSLPIVAVNIWYHVGSKNETSGRTGFAHLFEHLMFEGSQHYDRGYFHPLQEAGASLNGSTNADRTNYWEVVPTSAVDLALWMESDRMGYLLPALTNERFETQRDVVLNERRQNYENRPYGFALMALLAALYPPDHPYHWMTIAAVEDVAAVSLAGVRTAAGGGRVRLPELAGTRGVLPAGRYGGSGPFAERDRRRVGPDDPGRGRSGAKGRRDGTRRGAGRSTLPVPPA